jgi:hypothetical protein
MTFAGCVLVVVVLYWAQAVFVPIALAQVRADSLVIFSGTITPQ